LDGILSKRARKFAKIWFVSNRRVHGLWQSTVPSRFLDDLPEEHVEVSEPASYGGYGGMGGHGGMGGYGTSRFDNMEPFNSAYRTPGWQRAQANRGTHDPRKRVEREPVTIEGELVARSVIGGTARFATGDRVFHQKFGPGTVAGVDGNKLTVDFDHAGQKRVVDSFVESV